MKKGYGAIFDLGLASENEGKIIKFLDKINSIPFDKPEVWEKEIFSFFSNELIVPYTINTHTKELEDEGEWKKEYFEIVKRNFFIDKICGELIYWDSNQCYKSLIKIRESLKAGVNIKHYLPFLFLNNNLIRKMNVKITDENDSRFKNFGISIKPICYELKTKEGIIGYETIYFILPDKDVDYPIDKWYDKISKKWRLKLRGELNTKSNKRKRNPIDSKLRHECFKRDNYRCLECGNTNKESQLHADHIIPVSQGGVDELDNLQTLCEVCNLAKSNKSWDGGKNG